jgi:hypothetical protein
LASPQQSSRSLPPFLSPGAKVVDRHEIVGIARGLATHIDDGERSYEFAAAIFNGRARSKNRSAHRDACRRAR